MPEAALNERAFPAVDLDAVAIPAIVFCLFIASLFVRESAIFYLFWTPIFFLLCFMQPKSLAPLLIGAALIFGPTKPPGIPFAVTDLVVFAIFGRVYFARKQRAVSFAGEMSAVDRRISMALCILGAASVLFVALTGGALGEALKVLLRFAQYSIAFYCLRSLFVDREQVSAAERMLIIVTLAISLFGMVQFAIGPELSARLFRWGPWFTSGYESESFRVYSVLTNPIYLGAFCGVMVPFIFDRWLSTRRLFYLIALGATTICLFLTISRTGFLAAIMGLIVVSGINARKLLITSLALTLVLTFLVSDVVLDRIFARTPDAMINIAGRVLSAYEAGTIIVANPVTGIGVGQYQSYLLRNVRPDVTEEELDSLTAENTLLQFGAEMGVPGILLFGWIAAVFLRRSFWLKRANVPGGAGYAGAGVALIVSNMFASMTAVSMMLFMVTLAALVSALRQLNETKSPAESGAA